MSGNIAKPIQHFYVCQISIKSIFRIANYPTNATNYNIMFFVFSNQPGLLLSRQIDLLQNAFYEHYVTRQYQRYRKNAMVNHRVISLWWCWEYIGNSSCHRCEEPGHTKIEFKVLGYLFIFLMEVEWDVSISFDGKFGKMSHRLRHTLFIL